MKIIIVGLGKVGQSLASELSREGHDITIIDKKEKTIQQFMDQYDVMGFLGNGASYSTLTEAGVATADLLIAVTESDELNLLCCLIAKKAGNCNTIARVRNPEYRTELDFIKEELGLAMVINPEFEAAAEIARGLQFPSAIDVDTFAKSHVDILKFRVSEESMLVNKKLSDVASKIHGNVLICAAERKDELIVPDGNFVFKARDLISVVGDANDANKFFDQIGITANQVRSVLIVGGSSTAYYLAQGLLAQGIRVKIIEKDYKRCEHLCDILPKATIVHGDGTDKELLIEEGFDRYDSVTALTNIDEENILLSLYAKKAGISKVVTKINRIAFDEVIRGLDLDSIIHPKDITAEHIIRYVRSMNNSMDSDFESLHKIIDNKAEALEFVIRHKSKVTDVPLQELNIRKGILVGCITRDGKIIIPRGMDKMKVGDCVVIITQNTGLNSLEDILA